jgi:hypothetical protein
MTRRMGADDALTIGAVARRIAATRVLVTDCEGQVWQRRAPRWHQVSEALLDKIAFDADDPCQTSIDRRAEILGLVKCITLDTALRRGPPDVGRRPLPTSGRHLLKRCIAIIKARQ